MKSLVRPVGPASPATYWRRRVFVVALAVILAYVLIRACSPGPSASDPAAMNNEQPDQEPPASVTSSPSDPTTSTGDGEDQPTDQPPAETPGTGETTQASGGGGVRPGYCLEENVRLDIRPSKRQYQPTEDPRFALLFVNVGEAPCRFEVGSAGWSVEIRSGESRIWSTDDCVTEEASEPQTLDRLTPLSIDIGWDRRRSDPDCPTGERPVAEPGTYTITAKAGDVVSPKAVFILASGEAG